MKPILFNTEMVRATMEGRKTVTRRVVRPKYCDSVFEVLHGKLYETSPYEPPRDNGDGTKTFSVRPYFPCKPPYHPGDILYVRETWGIAFSYGTHGVGKTGFYVYRADGDELAPTLSGKWCPSIHMPKEAARLFLRVKDVRVERLQDITIEDIHSEGWPEYFMPTYDELKKMVTEFVSLWDSTIRPANLARYGWAANPWVWVIEFEKISKEEAEHGT